MTADIVIRTKKFQKNPLLNRKQCLVEVFHQEKGDVTNADIQAGVAKKFKVDKDLIQIFGSSTKFGGGKTVSFCLIYDNMDSLKKFEPKYRLLRAKIIEEEKVSKNRRTKKEEKNKKKKIRGTGKKKAKK